MNFAAGPRGILGTAGGQDHGVLERIPRPALCVGHTSRDIHRPGPVVRSARAAVGLFVRGTRFERGRRPHSLTTSRWPNHTEVTFLSMPSSDLRIALSKRKPLFLIAAGFAFLAGVIPLAVAADDNTATQAAGVAADTVWVIVTGCLVMFMQAGFAMLEVGFSRMKNVGTVVAKVVTNLSVSSIAYWAVGFGFAFGAGGIFAVIGGSGFFPT